MWRRKAPSHKEIDVLVVTLRNCCTCVRMSHKTGGNTVDGGFQKIVQVFFVLYRNSVLSSWLFRGRTLVNFFCCLRWTKVTETWICLDLEIHIHMVMSILLDSGGHLDWEWQYLVGSLLSMCVDWTCFYFGYFCYVELYPSCFQTSLCTSSVNPSTTHNRVGQCFFVSGSLVLLTDVSQRVSVGHLIKLAVLI